MVDCLSLNFQEQNLCSVISLHVVLFLSEFNEMLHKLDTRTQSSAPQLERVRDKRNQPASHGFPEWMVRSTSGKVIRM